jgi:outer membrane protein insertion porin family
LQRREQLGRVFLTAPTFAGWPIESSLVMEQSRETFAADTLISSIQSISWGQRTRLKNALSVLYTYNFDRNHTFDTKPSQDPTVPTFDITVNIARLIVAPAWDTRDDPFDATRGTLMSSSLEYGPTSPGSDIRFLKSVNQAYKFTPWRGIVFASAGRLGVAKALGDQELIPSERFFAGGAGTVRGVAEDALGPRDFFGDPAGGKAMVVLNQEARIPINKWIRGVAFFDAGNVFERWSDVRLKDLTGSIGFGARIATPFALLRVDYGRAIWTGSPAPATGRWIFGIGQAF